jgi:hypothetical protein
MKSIVVRDNGKRWTRDTWAVGDYRGGIIAKIPYCNEDSKKWAIGIAGQIIAKVETSCSSEVQYAE